MSVLIISAAGDWSAGQVTAELTRRGIPHSWIDTGDFPQRLQASAELGRGTWLGTLAGPDALVDLQTVSAVFYRRPSDFTFSPLMSGPERHFARAQARVAIGGILAGLTAQWINHPSALADAEYKPRQLATARRLGMTVPPTLITNRRDAVRRFAQRHGQLIVKPLAEPIVEEAGTYTPVWTRRLNPDDLHHLGGVEVTAHLFQQWVPKAYEVRLIAVGDRLFPVAIHAASDAARIDWRSDYDALTYELITCPVEVTDHVKDFRRAFGLTYAAFDFVITSEGRWVFLECNGAGQWGWLADELDLPIAAALANELTKEIM